MKVIPVIDLEAGAVVHARRGERDGYRPVVSQLCRGSRPLDIVAGFLAVYPFDALYVADLDAIQGRGDNDGIVGDLQRRFPHLELWVDRGLSDAAACQAWLDGHSGALVLGSEAVSDAGVLQRLGDAVRERLVLSLDFRDEQLLGPRDLLARVEDWPERLIVMTLSRVGSDAGPDLPLLEAFRHHAPGRQIFAAGGVRGGEDLLELARRGLSGVLVATAIHDGRIGQAEIAAVATTSA